MKKNFGKLQIRIIVLLCFIVLLPICLLSFINYQITLGNTRNQTERFSKQLLEQAMNEHSLVNEQVKSVMYDMLGSIDKYSAVMDEYYKNAQTLSFIKEMEQRIAIHNNYVLSVYILDFNKNRVYSSFDNRLVDFKDFYDQNFLDQIERKTEYTGFRYVTRDISEQKGNSRGTVTEPMREMLQKQRGEIGTYYLYAGNENAGGQVKIIAINVKQDYLREWENQLFDKTGGYYFITDSQHSYLYQSSSVSTLLDQVQHKYGDDPDTEVEIDNYKFLNLRLSNPTTQFDYWLLIPQQSFTDLVYRQSAVFILIGIISAVISIIVVIASSRYLYKPISHVVTAVSNRFPVHSRQSRDELRYIDYALTELAGENQSLNEAVRNHGPVIKQNMLWRLLQGRFSKTETRLPVLDLKFDDPYFVVISLNIEWGDKQREQYSETDVELTSYAIRNIAEETLSSGGSVQTLTRNKDTIVIVYNLETSVSPQLLIELAVQVQQNVKSYLKLPLDIGIGTVKEGVSDIWISFQESLQCLTYNQLLDPGNITHFNEITQHYTPRLVSFSWLNYEQDYIRFTRHCDRIGMSSLVTTIKEEAKLYQATSSEIHLFALQFSACTVKLMEEYSMYMEHGPIYNSISNILQNNRFADLILQIQALTDNLMQFVEEKRSHINRDLFKQAVLIIEQDPGVTVEHIAATVSLSPPSMNRLFREFKGMTAGEYILSSKMKLAKDLLMNTDYKIEDIASKVGYSTPRGFYKVFKEAVGTTPSEFRKTKL
jgi:two-component system response regulator YesN